MRGCQRGYKQAGGSKRKHKFCFSKDYLKLQGLIRCLEAGLEILELEAKELEGSVLPIWVWVIVCTAILLVLGGVGIGLYLRHR